MKPLIPVAIALAIVTIGAGAGNYQALIATLLLVVAVCSGDQPAGERPDHGAIDAPAEAASDRDDAPAEAAPAHA